jgi:hypothetical protein
MARSHGGPFTSPHATSLVKIRLPAEDGQCLSQPGRAGYGSELAMTARKRSTLWRRMRKLRRDPRSFFSDAVAKRIDDLDALAARIRSARAPAPAMSVAECGELSADELLASLAERFPLLCTVHDIDCRFGILARHASAIIADLADYARPRGLHIVVAVAGDRFAADASPSPGLSRALRRAPAFQVEFRHGAERLLALELVSYHEERGVLVTSADAIMRSLPHALSRELLAGGTGLWWPEEALGGAALAVPRPWRGETPASPA